MKTLIIPFDLSDDSQNVLNKIIDNTSVTDVPHNIILLNIISTLEEVQFGFRKNEEAFLQASVNWKLDQIIKKTKDILPPNISLEYKSLFGNTAKILLEEAAPLNATIVIPPYTETLEKQLQKEFAKATAYENTSILLSPYRSSRDEKQLVSPHSKAENISEQKSQNTSSVGEHLVSSIKHIFRLLSFGVLLTFTTSLHAQLQVGEEVLGLQEGDQAGYKVSMSDNGKRIAISSVTSSSSKLNEGQVRVFEFVDGTWEQLGCAINGNNSLGFLGTSNALSPDGNILAVSTIDHRSEGEVHVFEYKEGEWIQLGRAIKGENDGDWFGSAIALSENGKAIVIGAPASKDNLGAVKLFQFDNGAWQQIGNTLTGEYAKGHFGNAVSISSDGTKIAVGAFLSDSNKWHSGQVNVYQLEKNQWKALGEPIKGSEEKEQLGQSISLSADGLHLAVGATGYNKFSGQVSVFTFDSGQWIQRGQGINGVDAYDHFGLSVALSADGNKLIVGAPGHSKNGDLAGQVRLLEWQQGKWNTKGDILYGKNPHDEFGNNVTISSDGNFLMIGARLSDRNGSNSGEARVYNWPDKNKGANVFTASLNDTEQEFQIKENETSLLKNDLMIQVSNHQIFEVYPNIKKDEYTIKLNSNKEEKVFIRFLTSSGQLLWQHELSEKTKRWEKQFNLSDGHDWYYLIFCTADEVLTQRLIPN